MPDAHDPAALVRHAVAGGRLAARRADRAHARRPLERDALGAGRSRLRRTRPETRPRRRRAAITIAADGGDRTARRGVPRRDPELRMGRRDAAGADRGDRRHPRRAAGARRRGPRNGPGRARARPRASRSSGLLLPRSARSGSTPRRPDSGRRGDGSRSPTSSALAPSPRRRGARRVLPLRIDRARRHRAHATRSRPPRTRPTCSRPRC